MLIIVKDKIFLDKEKSPKTELKSTSSLFINKQKKTGSHLEITSKC